MRYVKTIRLILSSYGLEEDTQFESELQPLANLKQNERVGLERVCGIRTGLQLMCAQLMMEMPADEAIELNKKRKVMHWDTTKKRWDFSVSSFQLSQVQIRSHECIRFSRPGIIMTSFCRQAHLSILEGTITSTD